ncbi:hypothetical protein L6R52_31920 [Myxococcota bacterium]|nr:hypothetical protein [Myxococcota bacterium]
MIPLVLALGAALASCAHTRMSCVERAEEQYRRCVSPYVVINEGTEPNPVKGEDAQACREAYEQALSRCDPPPAVPMPAIPGTATSTAPKP